MKSTPIKINKRMNRIGNVMVSRKRMEKIAKNNLGGLGKLGRDSNGFIGSSRRQINFPEDNIQKMIKAPQKKMMRRLPIKPNTQNYRISDIKPRDLSVNKVHRHGTHSIRNIQGKLMMIKGDREQGKMRSKRCIVNN